MESRLTAWGEACGGGGIEQKGKGLMDMDTSVLIAGGEEYKGINGNGKIQKKKKEKEISIA